MERRKCESVDASKPHWVVTSSELTIILRKGVATDAAVPTEPVAFLFSLAPAGPAVLQVNSPEMLANYEDYDLSLLVGAQAFRRLGGVVEDLDGVAFHLPVELRAMAMSLRDCALPGERGRHYRSAKAVELLCEAMQLLEGDDRTATASNNSLSLADSRRFLAARDFIHQHCGEALTLELVGRACGLSRGKLSRGFRMMFGCTVAEAISERRLLQASRLLRTTDLPIASIAYRSGYQNNASFARAFGRHFGVPPSNYRSCGLAA